MNTAPGNEQLPVGFHLSHYVGSNAQHNSYNSSMPPLPKVGQTRCYWALLSETLEFIYLDPVLSDHCEDQAELLIGRGLLDFVHPDERASAKHDLGSVLQSRTLHGSVTRVRFSRLSSIRRQLGHSGAPFNWPDAEKVALDSNYMAVDIVINWAAEGLVLCFIHAIVDLNPTNDNDPSSKSGWTNWCGTPYMAPEQLGLLYARLNKRVAHPREHTRMFQILANQAGRCLLVSWPGDRPGEHIGSADFARLGADVQIGGQSDSGTGPAAHANEAKTNCTRRYKAYQELRPASGVHVESIFIPHGSVIFACHKIDQSQHTESSSSAPPMAAQVGGYPPTGSAYPHQPYYDPGSQYPQHHSQSIQNVVNNYMQGIPGYATAGQWTQNARSGSHPPGQAQAPWSPDTIPSGYNTQQSHSQSQHSMYAGAIDGPGGAEGGANAVPPPRRRTSADMGKDGAGEYPASGSGGGAVKGAHNNRPAGIVMCSSCKTTNSPEWRKGPSGKKELCNACGLRYARSRAKKDKERNVNHPGRKRKDKATNAAAVMAGPGGVTKRESSTAPSTPASASSPTSLSFPGSAISAPSPSLPSSLRRGPEDHGSASGHHHSPGPFFSGSSTASASPSNESFGHHPHSHSHGHHHGYPYPPASPSPSVGSVGSSNLSFVHYSPQHHLHHDEDGMYPSASAGSAGMMSGPGGMYGGHHGYHQSSPLAAMPPVMVPHPHDQHSMNQQHQQHSHPHQALHHLPPLHGHPESPTSSSLTGRGGLATPASYERERENGPKGNATSRGNKSKTAAGS
ncbi:hypothetical protein BDV98DRAFT_563343 [Pterulicium gracile]|uniref:GATA-type domain-containing protein n=1 Tax=Pterulicium gracile TaxID=1884261 RepID=A0A5C3R002_9AGAR|nr:hypothetical protein BDV98DRAFT_563343 [Pterula gracilis]